MPVQLEQGIARQDVGGAPGLVEGQPGDAIGIDLYWPLSGWRDGSTHADRLAGAASIYDLAYLTSSIFGGEGYDWYYASAADRAAQARSPITDGGAGKPWVFRFKDIRG